MVRDATAADWPLIWSFMSQIVAAGDTFAYDERMGVAEARKMWLRDPPGRTVVAVDPEGNVLGTATMGPNHAGPGAHVATASFMVDPGRWGKGVGRALCQETIDWARSQGFRAIQFNAVAETNTHAVALYQSLGFEVLATIPEAFRHPTEGYVGLHVMHRRL
jgi:L-amino acid N-acyltransferase YncA